MRTNLLKKTGAVLLTAAVAVGSVWSATKQSKAADTKYVKSSQAEMYRYQHLRKNRMSLMLSVASRHILFYMQRKMSADRYHIIRMENIS